MSSLQKQLLTKGKLPPMPPVGTGDGRRAFGRRRNYVPTSWNKYYETQEDVTISEGNIFRVYRIGNSGPLLVLLHGGGYSGLTWSLMAANIKTLVECQILAVDLRGHGNTITTDDEDLSANTMSNDVGSVLKTMYPDDMPPVILVGHSMGGAIAVHTAYQNLLPSLVGLVVIDVVEGTALDALQSMQSFLRGRPTSFRSLENAVEWCVRSGQVRNLESAKVSMPAQIKNMVTDKLATEDLHEGFETDSVTEASGTSVLSRGNSIPEESEEDEEQQNEQSPKKSKSEDGHFKVPTGIPVENVKYVWRIDLSKTEKYWTGWFEGLSNMFLNCTSAKMLLLAGVDRLDKDLTIGQMQGKFQMQVLPQCGHAVHEDVPEKVAEVLASFLARNKFAQTLNNFQT